MNKYYSLILFIVLFQCSPAFAMSREKYAEQYHESKCREAGKEYARYLDQKYRSKIDPNCSFALKTLSGFGMYGLGAHQLAQGDVIAATGFAISGTFFLYKAIKDTRWP